MASSGDHLLIVSEAHLHRLLAMYIGFYNATRPIKGWTSACPSPHHLRPTLVRSGRSLLGGLLRSYDRAAA